MNLELDQIEMMMNLWSLLRSSEAFDVFVPLQKSPKENGLSKPASSGQELSSKPQCRSERSDIQGI